MPNISPETAIVLAISGLGMAWIITKFVIDLIKFFKNGKQMNSIAGLSFEERLAVVEGDTSKLKNNHIQHIQQDISEIKTELRRINDRQDNFSERITRLEARN